jgi:GNAT superfamily N-acetyltransferase
MQRRFRRRTRFDSSVGRRRHMHPCATENSLPDFLPGRLLLAPGSLRDYDALASFHYLHGRPATAAAVWTVRYVSRAHSRITGFQPVRAAHERRSVLSSRDRRHGLKTRDTRGALPRAGSALRIDSSRLVAAAVLSYPVPSCLPRRAALRIRGKRRAELRFANRHLRTISRVVVHPQFRALGLSGALIRRLFQHCDTRYVEALAVMADAHPMFTRVGMSRIHVACSSKTRRAHRPPAYFLIDRIAAGRDFPFASPSSALPPRATRRPRDLSSRNTKTKGV